jgi:hypothetical protein
MLHRQCGPQHPNEPYMQRKSPTAPLRYKKGFPKSYRDITLIPDNRYLLYRRRPNTRYRKLNSTIADSGDFNSRIVPYNLFLSLYFQAHINVKICNTVAAIRYVYKYIFKGHDLFYATVE